MNLHVYTPEQIAIRLDMKPAKVREIIRDECEAQTPDELRFIPGGRVHGNVMRIHAGIFDALTQRAIVAPAQPVTMLHSRKVA